MTKCYRCNGRGTVLDPTGDTSEVSGHRTLCPQCSGGPRYRHPQNRNDTSKSEPIEALTQFYASNTPTPAQTHLRNLFLDKGVA